MAIPSSAGAPQRAEAAPTAKPAPRPAAASRGSRPDSLSPARGILLGLVAGALVWTLVILFWMGVL